MPCPAPSQLGIEGCKIHRSAAAIEDCRQPVSPIYSRVHQNPFGGGMVRFAIRDSVPFQKRPDVHKIVLSIKSRSPPPPGKSVNFEDFILICTVFPHFGPFLGGGGVKTKFCGQEFYGHPDFSEPLWMARRFATRIRVKRANRFA